MKRYSPRTLAHARRGHGIDSILFPWVSARSARHGDMRPRLLRPAASQSALTARAWVWVGVGVLAGGAVSAVSLYGWMFSLFLR
jgi:hypothetical protein